MEVSKHMVDFEPLTSSTPKLKDFRYAASDCILAETETKQLIGYTTFAAQHVVFHVKQTGNHIIQMCRTLEEAVVAYNELP